MYGKSPEWSQDWCNGHSGYFPLQKYTLPLTTGFSTPHTPSPRHSWFHQTHPQDRPSQHTLIKPPAPHSLPVFSQIQSFPMYEWLPHFAETFLLLCRHLIPCRRLHSFLLKYPTDFVLETDFLFPVKYHSHWLEQILPMVKYLPLTESPSLLKRFLFHQPQFPVLPLPAAMLFLPASAYTGHTLPCLLPKDNDPLSSAFQSVLPRYSMKEELPHPVS